MRRTWMLGRAGPGYIATTGPSVMTRPSPYTLTTGNRPASMAGVTKPPVYSTRNATVEGSAAEPPPGAEVLGVSWAHAATRKNIDAAAAARAPRAIVISI
ncbi:hypothetical protein Prum_058100 [Phytohabitans rumicis]|uniref:Uncharacterized protein n=1 Tax=Phytohabitans rumicis TaxID=1076125 RepID=A0A6V8LAW4_9ACTN|nr:hypothetical protein Prum_058100 [Phytohabitans rumicis]